MAEMTPELKAKLARNLKMARAALTKKRKGWGRKGGRRTKALREPITVNHPLADQLRGLRASLEQELEGARQTVELIEGLLGVLERGF